MTDEEFDRQFPNCASVKAQVEKHGLTEIVQAEARLVFMARWEANLWHLASSYSE